MNQQWIVDDYKRHVHGYLNGSYTGPAKFLEPPKPQRNILDVTAKAFGVAVAQLKGDSHKPDIVAARWCAMWVMHLRRGMSSTQIGLALDKDHTTVLHALKRFDERILSDPDYHGKVQQVLRTVGLK